MIEECLVVEFSVTGDDCPLAAATRETGATVDCQPPQLRRDENALLRFSTADDAVGGVLDADERIRYLHASRTDDRVNYRCLSRHPCVVHELIDAGLLVDRIRYAGGTERYAGAVVGYDVLQGVLEAAGETVGVTLERVYPLGADDEGAVARGWDLTPAQAEAMRTALAMGYFAVPRAATAAEVAAELGISKSAFLERLRRGQATLFAQVFD
ncbi:transcriptional regulator [Halobacteriales archaeon QS_1_68_20]|nr:MAG: transcriptional regulator [Halobacteriales archaeon QS_1_68_20]